MLRKLKEILGLSTLNKAPYSLWLSLHLLLT